MKKLLTLLILTVTLTGCIKDPIEYCGEVTGGYSDFDAYGIEYFYLRLNNKRHRVDQKTYESFFVGDFICLE